MKQHSHFCELLCQHMYALQKSGILCDIQVELTGSAAPIDLHSVVLAGSCSKFRDELLQNEDEAGVSSFTVLGDLEKESLEQLVRFLYTGTIDLDLCNIDKLRLCCVTLQLKEALELIDEHTHRALDFTGRLSDTEESISPAPKSIDGQAEDQEKEPNSNIIEGTNLQQSDLEMERNSNVFEEKLTEVETDSLKQEIDNLEVNELLSRSEENLKTADQAMEQNSNIAEENELDLNDVKELNEQNLQTNEKFVKSDQEIERNSNLGEEIMEEESSNVNEEKLKNVQNKQDCDSVEALPDSKEDSQHSTSLCESNSENSNEKVETRNSENLIEKIETQNSENVNDEIEPKNHDNSNLQIEQSSNLISEANSNISTEQNSSVSDKNLSKPVEALPDVTITVTDQGKSGQTDDKPEHKVTDKVLTGQTDERNTEELIPISLKPVTKDTAVQTDDYYIMHTKMPITINIPSTTMEKPAQITTVTRKIPTDITTTNTPREIPSGITTTNKTSKIPADVTTPILTTGTPTKIITVTKKIHSDTTKQNITTKIPNDITTKDTGEIPDETTVINLDDDSDSDDMDVVMNDNMTNLSDDIPITVINLPSVGKQINTASLGGKNSNRDLQNRNQPSSKVQGLHKTCVNRIIVKSPELPRNPSVMSSPRFMLSPVQVQQLKDSQISPKKFIVTGSPSLQVSRSPATKTVRILTRAALKSSAVTPSPVALFERSQFVGGQNSALKSPTGQLNMSPRVMISPVKLQGNVSMTALKTDEKLRCIVISPGNEDDDLQNSTAKVLTSSTRRVIPISKKVHKTNELPGIHAIAGPSKVPARSTPVLSSAFSTGKPNELKRQNRELSPCDFKTSKISSSSHEKESSIKIMASEKMRASDNKARSTPKRLRKPPQKYADMITYSDNEPSESNHQETDQSSSGEVYYGNSSQETDDNNLSGEDSDSDRMFTFSKSMDDDVIADKTAKKRIKSYKKKQSRSKRNSLLQSSKLQRYGGYDSSDSSDGEVQNKSVLIGNKPIPYTVIKGGKDEASGTDLAAADSTTQPEIKTEIVEDAEEKLYEASTGFVDLTLLSDSEAEKMRQMSTQDNNKNNNSQCSDSKQLGDKASENSATVQRSPVYKNVKIPSLQVMRSKLNCNRKISFAAKDNDETNTTIITENVSQPSPNISKLQKSSLVVVRNPDYRRIMPNPTNVHVASNATPNKSIESTSNGIVTTSNEITSQKKEDIETNNDDVEFVKESRIEKKMPKIVYIRTQSNENKMIREDDPKMEEARKKLITIFKQASEKIKLFSKNPKGNEKKTDVDDCDENDSDGEMAGKGGSKSASEASDNGGCYSPLPTCSQELPEASLYLEDEVSFSFDANTACFDNDDGKSGKSQEKDGGNDRNNKRGRRSGGANNRKDGTDKNKDNGGDKSSSGDQNNDQNNSDDKNNDGNDKNNGDKNNDKKDQSKDKNNKNNKKKNKQSDETDQDENNEDGDLESSLIDETGDKINSKGQNNDKKGKNKTIKGKNTDKLGKNNKRKKRKLHETDQDDSLANTTNDEIEMNNETNDENLEHEKENCQTDATTCESDSYLVPETITRTAPRKNLMGLRTRRAARSPMVSDQEVDNRAITTPRASHRSVESSELSDNTGARGRRSLGYDTADSSDSARSCSRESRRSTKRPWRFSSEFVQPTKRQHTSPSHGSPPKKRKESTDDSSTPKPSAKPTPTPKDDTKGKGRAKMKHTGRPRKPKMEYIIINRFRSYNMIHFGHVLFHLPTVKVTDMNRIPQLRQAITDQPEPFKLTEDFLKSLPALKPAPLPPKVQTSKRGKGRPRKGTREGDDGKENSAKKYVRKTPKPIMPKIEYDTTEVGSGRKKLSKEEEEEFLLADDYGEEYDIGLRLLVDLNYSLPKAASVANVNPSRLKLYVKKKQNEGALQKIVFRTRVRDKTLKFHCKCGLSYVTNNSLLQHLDENVCEFGGDSVFKTCGKCRQPAWDEETFMEHNEEEHWVSRVILKCDYCDYQIRNSKLMIYHMKYDHDIPMVEQRKKESVFVCTNANCSYETMYDTALDLHQKSHRQKMFRCFRCDDTFTTYEGWVEHRRTHKGVAISRCVDCGQTFKDAGLWKEHVVLVHNKEITVSITKLTNEEVYTPNDNIQFTCDLCPNFTTKSKHILAVHKYMEHRSGAPKQLSHAPVRQEILTGGKPKENFPPWSCDICGLFEGTSAVTLATHKYREHGEDFDHKKYQIYPCSYCSFTCQNASVSRHHADSHVTTGMTFKCKHCGRWFMYEDEYSQHLSTHIRGKRLSCMYAWCKFTCVLEDNLEKHLIIRHPQQFEGDDSWPLLDRSPSDPDAVAQMAMDVLGQTSLDIITPGKPKAGKYSPGKHKRKLGHRKMVKQSTSQQKLSDSLITPRKTINKADPNASLFSTWDTLLTGEVNDSSGPDLETVGSANTTPAKSINPLDTDDLFQSLHSANFSMEVDSSDQNEAAENQGVDSDIIKRILDLNKDIHDMGGNVSDMEGMAADNEVDDNIGNVSNTSIMSDNRGAAVTTSISASDIGVCSIDIKDFDTSQIQFLETDSDLVTLSDKNDVSLVTVDDNDFTLTPDITWTTVQEVGAPAEEVAVHDISATVMPSGQIVILNDAQMEDFQLQ